ncbi:MAG: SMI1/KNR4 family protein [Eudoraea sp.]|nr:SMI1/KNR4 family protein [Eudoraea sp.]
MNEAYGKVFTTSEGEEFGIIREAKAPFPEELSKMKVTAEDECGNYFIVIDGKVAFWDHETSEKIILANSIEEFISGCAEPSKVELKPGQVESVWIDPEFAKEMGIDEKP